MRRHVEAVAWLQIVLGALGVLTGMMLLLFFGGLGTFAAATGAHSGDPDAVIALPVLGAVGAGIFVLLVVISAPGLIAGIGLLKWQPWARILTIVLAAINLLNVPIGTALGIYALWVMLQEETVRLFEQPPPPDVRA